MVYNTRRKSLSLPSLGIHVPVTNAERAAAAAAAAAALVASSEKNALSPRRSQNSTTSASVCALKSPRPSRTPSLSDAERIASPKRKMKRSMSNDAQQGAGAKRLQTENARFELDLVRETTPPASPAASHAPSVEMMDVCNDVNQAAKTIDLKEIGDDIVEAVIVRLQSTDNRPHLVKELSTVLMPQLRIVQQSANPCAIISSRLSTFLKRTCFNASSPCPLAKELESVHPRRTYFYLTTCPHEPIPHPSQAVSGTSPSPLPSALLAPNRAPITPSLSSGSGSVGATDEEDRRRELSPSPEVELSCPPDFDEILLDHDDGSEPPLPALLGAYPTTRRTVMSSASRNLRHPRGPSPPLERDEMEFTQTANGLLRMRQLDAASKANTVATATMTAAVSSAPVAPPATAAKPADVTDPTVSDAKPTKVSESLTEDDKSKSAAPSVIVSSHLEPSNMLSPPSFNMMSSPSVTALGAAPYVLSPSLRPTLANLHINGSSPLMPYKKDHAELDSWASLESLHEWDRSPEKIELEELDFWLDEIR